MKTFYEIFRELPTSFLELKKEDIIGNLHQRYEKCKCGKDLSVKSLGVINPYLMVIGLKPSQYDIETGSLFSDKIGQKAFGLIEYVGRYKKTTNNVYMTALSWCECGKIDSNRIKNEIITIRPKKILLLGFDVAGEFGITKDQRLHTHSLKFNNFIPVYVTYSLHEIFYLNGEIKLQVKEDLDYLIND